MRIRWLQIGAVVIAIMVLAVSMVSAREDDQKNTQVLESTMSAQETEVNEEVMAVNYYLPYPGMLPDHFLYPVKMIRDRIALWLTTNKGAKVKLLELYADKRLGAAKVLLEGGETELGIDVGAKAIAYQDRAVTLMEEIKKEGNEEGEIANQLERATARHSEVWGELVKTVDEQSKPRMDEYKDKTMELNKRMQRVLGRE